ncbi:MAG: hypothetical protein KGL90_08005 [Burkholderiales bacterium]|nr:hypothetical protein [Burkholderiales bacterium]
MNPLAQAGSTDISNTPLASTADITAKPNLMFVLDGSGSMAWAFMPDDVGQDFSNPSSNPTDSIALGRYGGRSAQCNGLAYNPSFPYEGKLPVKPDGSPYPHASFTAAPTDGFQAGATNPNSLTAPITIGTGDLTFKISGTPLASNTTVGNPVVIYSSTDDSKWMIGTVKSWSSPLVTVTITDAAGGGDPTATTWRIGTRTVTDLTNSYYYTYSGTKTALGWKYTTAGLDRTNDGGFANECLTSTSTASSVFTKVTLTSASAEAQRYADWYAYYRKRFLLMRTVAGKSFKLIDDKFRVGFTTIADTTATPSSTFLEVNAFDATQKASFYASLYKADPNGSTPLRGALAKVGRYFANKAPGQQHDPMQYACQRNYTILSTDGYWNTALETPTYGPLKLDGTTPVGQQDALEPRAMYDGATVTVKTDTTWTTTSTKVDTTVTPNTTVSTSSVTTKTFTPVNGWNRNSYSLTGSANTNTNLARCSSGSFTGGKCKITVTTSGAHGFTTGDSVTIAGASNGYNGTFSIISTGASTFTYTLTGLTSRPSSAMTFGTSATSCRNLITQPQHGDEYTVTTSTVKDTTTTTSSTTAVKTTTIVTPWTNKIISTNGVVTTNTGDVAGTPTTTAPVVTSTATDPSTTSQQTTPGTSANVINWANNGAATTGATCAVLPSPNPSNPVAAPLASTTTYSGADPAVTTGPTTTSSTPSTTTVGPTVVSTPPVTNVTTTNAGGSSNSLADVAEYYYVTDLRTPALGNCTGALGFDVCNDEVPPSGRDTAATQHMTTFTLGLGVNGTLDYKANYLDPNQKTGAYYEILNNLNGTMWPNPNPTTEDATHVDDLWHAAVDGRGQYWAASDADALSKAISTALSSVMETIGASSSAATSSLKPVAGEDNLVFVATFKTVEWSGDLIAYTLDAKLGIIDLKNPVWSAKDQLAGVGAGTRKIYYAQPNVATPVRRDFSYTNLTADGFGSNFDNLCTQPVVAGQCATLNTSLQALANSGSNLVAYLRGDGSLTNYTYVPDPGQPTQTAKAAIYRPRTTALGDIINASPVYLSKPPFHYADTGYAAFVTSQANRAAVVFAAANDGMLHAFAAKTVTGGATGGSELWAYVPRAVIPNLYLLADTNYKDKHRYYVDGTPTIGDIYVNGAWKTILVGGLNSGGKSYYALDVTDPTNPVPLWEFTDANLGLTYGNPIITKRADGTWVVVFSSGYNNTNGDGNGRLYMVNAYTGVAPTGSPTITSIPTMISSTVPAGTSATPSGLGKINAWIEDSSDNTATRFYGGDLLGNLWRFDTDNLLAPKGKAMLLATFKTNATTPQPIMTRPETAVVTYNSVSYPVIMVGTGQYLGISDIANTTVQSIYAVKDTLAATGLGDVRARTDMVVQTLTNAAPVPGSTAQRTASTNAVDWSNASGWRVDLPSSGERVAIDMQLQYNTLEVISAIPGTNECKPAGGSSWLYSFDIAKGTAPVSAVGGVSGTYLGAFLGVGLTWIELGDGTSRLIIPGSDASMHVETPPASNTSGAPTAHRTSWRELVN